MSRPTARAPRAIAAAIAGMLLLGACSGPRAPLEVGSKEIPVDIVLGDQTRDVPPPPPGVDPGPAGFPGFLQPPAPRPQPGIPPRPVKPADPCPLANPLDAAVLVARLTARPPAEATYEYRNNGTIQVGEGARTAYPDTMTRSVRDVRPLAQDGNFEFDVASTVAGATTTTRYRVITQGSTPDRGVHIVRVVTETDERTQAFTPIEPLLLLPFPPPEYGTNLEDELDQYRGRRYRSVGTDPLTQTTMVLEAMLVGKTRVDACGEWVDAFDVEVTLGRITGPNRDIEFGGHYAVATQYGGLIVEDDITMTGTDNGERIDVKNRSRITRVPEEPA